jgi:hypothetical protein
MKIQTSNRREWFLGVIGLLVGLIGTFIESWGLKGGLDHRYPFKVMNVPPPEFYIEVSKTLAVFVPLVACLAGLFVLLVLKRNKLIAGVVPLIICPLGYVAGLWYLASSSEYKDQPYSPVNFDRSSAAMRHQEFSLEAFNLVLFSVITYLVFLALMYATNHWLKSKRIP